MYGHRSEAEVSEPLKSVAALIGSSRSRRWDVQVDPSDWWDFGRGDRDSDGEDEDDENADDENEDDEPVEEGRHRPAAARPESTRQSTVAEPTERRTTSQKL